MNPWFCELVFSNKQAKIRIVYCKLADRLNYMIKKKHILLHLTHKLCKNENYNEMDLEN